MYTVGNSGGIFAVSDTEEIFVLDMCKSSIIYNFTYTKLMPLS